MNRIQYAIFGRGKVISDLWRSDNRSWNLVVERSFRWIYEENDLCWLKALKLSRLLVSISLLPAEYCILQTESFTFLFYLLLYATLNLFSSVYYNKRKYTIAAPDVIAMTVFPSPLSSRQQKFHQHNAKLRMAILTNIYFMSNTSILSSFQTLKSV